MKKNCCPSVNRTDTIESSQGLITRRTSHRKLTTILPNGKPKLTDGLLSRMPRRKENCTWLVEEDRKNEEEVKMYSIKRGKRTLITEKFNNPRSVKVLRRSQAQNSTAIRGKATSKIQLPVVKVAKGM